MDKTAFRLAVRVMGSAEGAEDVVQEAYLAAIRQFDSGEAPVDERAWFLRVTANLAKRHVRGESRRRRREEHVEPGNPTAAAVDEELSGLLRAAMDALAEEFRVPLALCYEEGLSQQEAAAVLEIPESTLSRRLRAGIERLRVALKQAGCTAAPAVVIGALAHTGPAVPATLAAAVGKIVSGRATPVTGTGSEAGSVAAKAGGAALHGSGTTTGGLLMKIGLSVAAVGLAAGTAFWAAGGKSAESPAPPEQPKSKFAIPVWHPDVRWSPKCERFIGSGARGFLGGKASEAMWYGDGLGAGRCAYGSGAGPYGCTSYDPATGRFHLVAGASRGLLDGPFSRARFGGSDYSHRPRGATSPDGRYVFVSEPYFGQALRRMDLVKQEIKTVPMPPKTGIGGMAADSQGRLLVLVAYSDKLIFIDGDGKQVQELKLDMQEKVGDATFPCCLNLDEKNNRVYGSGYGVQKWYIWYWDLKDGSFHGVLPIPQQGEAKRNKDEAGPFKGTVLYKEMGTWFGPPDDPEKNFLYVTPNDCMTFFRLDLAKQEVWGCTSDKDGIRFIGSGGARGPSTGKESWGTHMDAQGDILTSIPFWNGPQLVRFPRVK
jgi:RNA polymerase sigma factor (sigma-70 family)